MSKKRKKHRRHIGKYILAALLMCAAFGLISYPFISNYLYENRADSVIESVEEEVTENAASEEYAEQIAQAQAYNESLLDGHVQLKDPFIEDSDDEDTVEYLSILNVTEDGCMGFIKIPCIDVSLPIYHGTSTDTLEKGAGHLQGSSLPVGGESTHTVITGHTGLSKAKLFTDLTELELGDIFFLDVMGLELAYEVDNIAVVDPEDSSLLGIEDGMDYCTLVTCTPYGINSHRLLVRGHRTDYEEAAEDESTYEAKTTTSKWMEEYVKSIIAGTVCFIELLLLLIIFRTVRDMRSQKWQKRQKNARKKRQRKPPG